jgi:hypothetical protein
MSSRALGKTSGSREIDMSPHAPAVTAPDESKRLAAAYAQQGGPPWPSNSPAGQWFGPGVPFAPIAPPDVAGRTWDFEAGYNFQNAPRPYEAVSAQDLRAVADACDVMRTVIETRKDQLAKLEWSIVPELMLDGSPATDPNNPAIAEITEFFLKPDQEHDWDQWLRMEVEDLLVLDAPTLYCRRTYDDTLLSLRPLDGAGIKRIIDEWGCTPEPPIPAYQHILHGVPAVDYTTNDVIWMPRNPRTNRGFGYGPVEQILITVDIALRKQLFMKDYFTDGNVPQSIIGAPDAWSTQQITDFQKYWDAMLKGNLEARRRAFFVPGGMAKTFITTKEPELTGKTEEWLARVICFAFSISPQPFLSMMNRATAETAKEAALEEGLYPLMQWVVRLMNRVIKRFWPGSKLQFKWNDDAQVDKAEQEGILTGYATKGVMTVNECRDTLGLDPKSGGDELRVMTGTGYVLIGVNDDAPTAGEQADAKAEATQALANKPAPVVAAQSAQPAQPPPEPKAAGEAPAAKASGAFRKRTRPITSQSYWTQGAAHRHDAPNARGAGR